MACVWNEGVPFTAVPPSPMRRGLKQKSGDPSPPNIWGGAASPMRRGADFVESIPFTETREYVEAVLRNATVYRLIYAGKAPAARAPSARRKPAAVTAPKSPAA